MHKILIDEGSYDFLNQLPQIIYSTAISSIISTAIGVLALTEKILTKIKKTKPKKKEIEIAIIEKKKFITKFYIFFIIGLFLLLFLWYYISAFLQYIKKTQIIFIKDTLISLGLSLLYPFGTCLLPGIFRLPALKAPKKNKKCLYSLSNIIAMI